MVGTAVISPVKLRSKRVTAIIQSDLFFFFPLTDEIQRLKKGICSRQSWEKPQNISLRLVVFAQYHAAAGGAEIKGSGIKPLCSSWDSVYCVCV